MQDVAIAGPGLMGLGVAQVCARAGHRVCLLGRDADSAERARAKLASQLQRQVERERMPSAEAAALLARVRAAASDADLAACTLAIESVREDRALKGEVLRRLEAALPPAALIATNTSGLPVSGLAGALRRPERFLGLHFFSPVERMPLVEVVRGAASAQATVRDALAFVRAIGQTPVVVRDGPGFFTSRVFATYLDEALALVGEGVAPARIEEAALALGRAIGPLALLDDISLALNLQQIHQARADGLPPQRCRPLAEPVLAALVAQGRRGRRDGGGFYDTAANGTRTLWSGLAGRFPPAARQPSPQRIAERLRWVEVLDALHCLEHGVVASADDADTASVLGLGFPKASGGVLRWAEDHGLDRLVATSEALAADCGARFAPSDWLRECARSGGLRGWRGHAEPQEAPQ